MKKLVLPFAGAGLVLLLGAAAVSAASPASPAPTYPWETPAPVVTPAPAVTPAATPAPAASTGTLAAILGLTDAQVMAFRQQGLSLAQIAGQQKVDPQTLIDALAATWSVRIDARLAAGALTADQAKVLKDNAAAQAKAMVYQAAMGGMRGAAVGAGPNSTTRGMGGGAGMGAGAGRGMMGGGNGAGAGTGTCPMAGATPSS
jgi:lambda repressor-like predicted transcriptional regulator